MNERANGTAKKAETNVSNAAQGAFFVLLQKVDCAAAVIIVKSIKRGLVCKSDEDIDENCNLSVVQKVGAPSVATNFVKVPRSILPP